MFSRSAPEPVTSPANAETRFSLPELRKLHKQLVDNKRVNEGNQALVVEILRVIAEMVVYGDNKSELLFDFFCEKNMLSLFLEIMATPGGCPSCVHIQILQTLSILISCVRNETSLYYLLSNNYINEIIIYQHDFMNDESLCAQFASFMKTLSLKLNIHTVQFFFIEETGAFPILTRAVELLTIPDPMIRIASQSTILNVYRVEDSRARAYALQDEVMGIMFAQTVNFMDNQYHNIFKTCKLYYKTSNTNDETSSVRLEGKLDDILSGMEDWFYYLQDLLDLDVPVLRKALVHQLIHDFLLPVLLAPLMKTHSVYLEEERTKGRGGRPVGLERSHSSSCSADEEQDSEKVRLPLVLGDAELEIFDSIELIASLSYLLQMLKIVTHPALQRAVLVTIFHPLSLDCRTEVLKEIDASKSVSGFASTADLTQSLSTGTLEGPLSTPIDGDGVASPKASAAAETCLSVPLSGNIIKEAWDRLHKGESQKVALVMMYIEHILLDRIVPTAIDSTPGNENMVQHVVDEEYLTAHCPAITPLRTLNDPKDDAIAMLQSLYYLPNKVYCDAQTYETAVSQTLNCSSGCGTPLPGPEKNRSGSNLSELSATEAGSKDRDMWSSALTGEDSEVTLSGGNLTADCDAEAETEADKGIAARFNQVTIVAEENPGDNATAESSINTAVPTVRDSCEEKEHPGEYGRLPRNSEDHNTPLAQTRQKGRGRLARNDMLVPTESTMGVGLNTADQLVLPTLRKMADVMAEKLPLYPAVPAAYSVEPVFEVLNHAHNYCITTIQVAAHMTYSLCLLAASARNAALPSRTSSKHTSFSGNPPSSSFSGNPKGSSFSSYTGGNPKNGSFSGGNMKNGSFSNPPVLPDIHRDREISFPEGCDLAGPMYQSLLEFLAMRVREACRFAALKLLERLEGTLAETVLNLVREETGRLDKQKWKRSIERMYQDVLLFLPPTQFSCERMGLDFELPFSQVETIRKEIQSFLVLRALYKKTHTIATTATALPDSVDDLCASITDSSFLCLEEKNMMAANYTTGAPYDMRGKRFLDIKIIPAAPKSTSFDTVNGASSAESPSRPVSPVRNPSSGSSSSIWGINAKRFFGGGLSTSSTAGSTSNSPNPLSTASPMPAGVAGSGLPSVKVEVDPIAELVAAKKKILFVQDAKSLVIVSCDKQDAKNSFKVLIAAPLMYTDAQMDPEDRLKFKLILRSTRTVEHMYPAEPDLSQLLREGGNDSVLDRSTVPASQLATPAGQSKTTTAPKFPVHKLESAKFLKPKGKTNFWQLTFRVENEQACKLAVHHIEQKRKDQTTGKMQQLQRVLEHWSSDRDINLKED